MLYIVISILGEHIGFLLLTGKINLNKITKRLEKSDHSLVESSYCSLLGILMYSMHCNFSISSFSKYHTKS